MLLATLIINALIFFAGGFTANNNGFNRKIENVSLPRISWIKKPQNITSISTVTKDHIYFQTTIPGKLIIVDHHLTDPQCVSIPYPSDQKTASLFYTIIDSPGIYLLAGNKGTIAHANLHNKTFYNYSFKLPVFTRTVFIPPATFIIRGYETSSIKPDQVFMKINTASSLLQREKNLSEKKRDAGITTDGLLQYDSSVHLLIYTFFYSNNIICFDTSLQLIYKAHTIDTTNAYQIQTGSIGTETEKVFTNTMPSRIVNWESDVSDGKLYINSWMKADNESIPQFNNNSVIDVYDIISGAYKKSFYVPFFRGEKMESFKVYKNEVIAIYKDYITVLAKPFKCRISKTLR